MSETGYRAFPPQIMPPSATQRLTAEEMESYEKVEMQVAQELVSGHLKTVIWYSPTKRFYILGIYFSEHAPVFAKSIATFTPSLGMDQIDGEFAQDVEAQIIHEKLGVSFPRLNIFEGNQPVEIETYLRSRGYWPK